MRNTMLLPHSFKRIGLLLFILFLMVCIAAYGYDFSFEFLKVKAPSSALISNDNLTDELALCGLMLSLMFMSFARERREDEYVNTLRLQSFQVSFMIYYVLMIACLFMFYGVAFLLVLAESLPLLLMLFLVIFHVRLKVLPFLSKQRTA